MPKCRIAEAVLFNSAQRLIKRVLISQQLYELKENLSLSLQTVIWLVGREIRHHLMLLFIRVCLNQFILFLLLMPMCIFCYQKEKQQMK